MKNILLPGMSARNKEWASQLQKDLKEMDIAIEFLEWEHWSTGRSHFSIKTEEEKLLSQIQDTKKYTILAKSVGTRLAAKMISDGKIVPEKIILMGVPSTNEIYIDAFTNFPAEKVKVIQNAHDPLASFKDISIFFSKINDGIEVIEVDESGHNYPYPELIASLL